MCMEKKRRENGELRPPYKPREIVKGFGKEA